DTVYAIARAPAAAQADLSRQVLDEGLTRREAQALAAAASDAEGAARPTGRTGRPRVSRTFETTLYAANGASVTVKFRKADVTPQEIAAALEDVLKTLRGEVAA